MKVTKFPVIPLAVATILIAGVVFLFKSASSGHRVFGQPRLEKLVDLDGTETQLTVSPDGTRLVAVASGDLWLFNISDGSRRRLTETEVAETSPAWAPDGNRVAFTRGTATYAMSPDRSLDPQVLKENATSLSWSTTGRMTFVRDRSLWVTDAGGLHDRRLVLPDANPDIVITTPRFSPDSTQVAFVKSDLGLQGEVWVADATDGTTRSLVADRPAENPLDVGWLDNGKQLLYLTNRGGGYGLWVIDLNVNTISPLTSTLNDMPLGRIGMTVWRDRIMLPRHDVDSNIVISDGTVVAQTSDIEFEPASSRDGELVAYTVRRNNKFEVWTAGIHGENPIFRAVGTQPRFSPNGFELVYTHTDILGQVDLWKVDLRDSSSSSITDASETDFQPDWSPDGRTIAFAANRTGTMMLWTVPAVDGKRVSLNSNGYFPRYSPDGRLVAFWNQRTLWTMDASGANVRRVRDDVEGPIPSGWIGGSLKTYLDPAVNEDRQIWPTFDVLPDGKLLTAPIETRETAVWVVNLTYVDK